MGKILAGCIIDQDSFRHFLHDRLGPFYKRAEEVFLAFGRKEPLLSYSITIIFIRSDEKGQAEEVLCALEQAAPKILEWQGNHRKTPNAQVIDEIVNQFNLA